MHRPTYLRRTVLQGGLSARAVVLLVSIVGSTAPRSDAAETADPAKVLRVAFPTDIGELDPGATQETYATIVENRIFDALYMWDYLARPFKFVPQIATALPEISADGRVWTIRIRPGIYFADDPAFGGKKRELTSADFVYSWKRLVDVNGDGLPDVVLRSGASVIVFLNTNR